MVSAPSCPPYPVSEASAEMIAYRIQPPVRQALALRTCTKLFRFFPLSNSVLPRPRLRSYVSGRPQLVPAKSRAPCSAGRSWQQSDCVGVLHTLTKSSGRPKCPAKETAGETSGRSRPLRSIGFALRGHRNRRRKDLPGISASGPGRQKRLEECGPEHREHRGTARCPCGRNPGCLTLSGSRIPMWQHRGVIARVTGTRRSGARHGRKE